MVEIPAERRAMGEDWASARVADSERLKLARTKMSSLSFLRPEVAHFARASNSLDSQ